MDSSDAPSRPGDSAISGLGFAPPGSSPLPASAKERNERRAAPAWERLLRRLAQECPRRRATGEQERRAQEILAEDLAQQGAEIAWLPFRFNDSLYATLALHCAIGCLGSAMYFVQPAVGLALHLLAAVSYTLDSADRAFLLRRLFRFRKSQNLLARLPAPEPVSRRIVFVAHADAAPTGWLFQSRLSHRPVGKNFPRPYGWLGKPLLALMAALVGLAAIDLLAMVQTPVMPLLYWSVTGACAFGLALNFQVWWGARYVVGAADNLSGCAALPELARRLGADKPEDVELAFVVTGCEETGRGGASALRRKLAAEWSPENTVVLALDPLANGQMHYKTGGEIVPVRPPDWLVATLQDVAAEDERFGEVPPCDPPAGSDDAYPFQIHGYAGVCLGAVDPAIGVCRHYHQPSDTPDNLDFASLARSIDYVELLGRRLIGKGAWPLAPGIENRPTLFGRLSGAWRWLLPMAIAAALYVGVMWRQDWAFSYLVFRVCWIVYLALLPVYLLARRLGFDPDRWRMPGRLGRLVGVAAAVSGVWMLVRAFLG